MNEVLKLTAKLWGTRYPDETEPVVEWHDDKPSGRTDIHITTEAGDLTAYGSQLKPGS